MCGHSTPNLLKHLRTHGVGAVDLKEVPGPLSKLEGTQSQDPCRLLSITGSERAPSIATTGRGVGDLYEARVSRLRSIFNRTYMPALAIDVYTCAGVAAHMNLESNPISSCLGTVRLSHPVRASEVQGGLDPQRERTACVG